MRTQLFAVPSLYCHHQYTDKQRWIQAYILLLLTTAIILQVLEGRHQLEQLEQIQCMVSQISFRRVWLCCESSMGCNCGNNKCCNPGSCSTGLVHILRWNSCHFVQCYVSSQKSRDKIKPSILGYVCQNYSSQNVVVPSRLAMLCIHTCAEYGFVSRRGVGQPSDFQYYRFIVFGRYDLHSVVLTLPAWVTLDGMVSPSNTLPNRYDLCPQIDRVPLFLQRPRDASPTHLSSDIVSCLACALCCNTVLFGCQFYVVCVAFHSNQEFSDQY